MAYNTIVQSATATVTINGNAIPATRLLAVEWEEGYDLKVARGSVTIDGKPTDYDFWYPAVITAGATAATSVQRFAGFVDRFQYKPDLPSTTVTIPFKGHLFKAEKYQVPQDAGTNDVPGYDLVNNGAGATDVAQTMAVLDRCGLSSYYSAANIGGVHELLGTQTAAKSKGAKTQFIWRRGSTGLSYLAQLDEICLGYRTYDSAGSIVRRQIYARPRGTAVATFTEGVDIFSQDASGLHEIDDAYNKIIITGFDYGDGPRRAEATGPHPKPNSQIDYITLAKSYPMLEKTKATDSGHGLSCQAVADWKLQELNHVRLSAKFTTYRDTLIRAGDTIDVLMDAGLEIYQSVFVRHVKGRVDKDGWVQEFDVVAPAEVGRGGAALPLELGVYGFVGLGGLN